MTDYSTGYLDALEDVSDRLTELRAERVDLTASEFQDVLLSWLDRIRPLLTAPAHATTPEDPDELGTANQGPSTRAAPTPVNHEPPRHES